MAMSDVPYSVGVPDWLEGFGSPGDPMAGSIYESVIGEAPGIDGVFDYPTWGGLPGLDNPAVSSGIGKAGSWLSKLFGLSDKSNDKAQGWADASSVLGSMSSGEKANRALMAQLMGGYDRSMLASERQRNENESDALKKLAQTGYILGGGSQFKMPIIELNGLNRTPPSFGFGPMAPSDAQKQGAQTLQGQLLKRLQPGGSYMPQKPNFNPGVMERIGDYGALATGGIGALNTILNGQPHDNDAWSIIQKFLPGNK